MEFDSVRAGLTRPVSALAARSPWSRSNRFARSVNGRAKGELVGLEGSGGRWQLPTRVLAAGSVCYCCGLGDDLGLELALGFLYGCVVYAFDPSPRVSALAADVPGVEDCFSFSALGVWSGDGILSFYAADGASQPQEVGSWSTTPRRDCLRMEASARSLSSLMRELDHPEIDLLKLDIEGAEGEVLRAAVEDGIEIGAISARFRSRTSMVETTSMLGEAGYRPLAVEGSSVTLLSETAAGDSF
jgi:FkbM family methyltransferase